MTSVTKQRIIDSVKEVFPTTLKTCIWILKITVGVSFFILLLKYFNILPWISNALNPVFKYIGLPGDAALAFVSGYFVNVYSAIAVISTLDLSPRSITILGTMILCAHSMILETAVVKKTGSSGTRIVIVRTLSAFILGYILNLIMPEIRQETSVITENTIAVSFGTMFLDWLKSTSMLCLKMIVIIFSLNIFQKLLSEFGIIARISKFLKPLLLIFGLPKKTAFLWIIANVIGLAYGAAAMLDETARGKISKKDIKLLNSHICISHSNLEDLLLLTALGATWWVMLLIRWAMSIVLVWEMRGEFYIKELISRKNRTFAT